MITPDLPLQSDIAAPTTETIKTQTDPAGTPNVIAPDADDGKPFSGTLIKKLFGEEYGSPAD